MLPALLVYISEQLVACAMDRDLRHLLNVIDNVTAAVIAACPDPAVRSDLVEAYGRFTFIMREALLNRKGDFNDDEVRAGLTADMQDKVGQFLVMINARADQGQAEEVKWPSVIH